MSETYYMKWNNETFGLLTYADGKFSASLINPDVTYPKVLFGLSPETFTPHVDDEQVRYWIAGRVVPERRENLHEVLAELGLDSYDPWTICKQLGGRSTRDSVSLELKTS